MSKPNAPLTVPMIVTGQGITIFVDGKTYPVNKDTPNYALVQKAIASGSMPKLMDALEIKHAIARFTEGRVSVVGDHLHYDNEPLHHALTSRVMEVIKAGWNVAPILKFLDNLLLNPSQTAIDELYGFLEACDLPITPEGHFLAYKLINDDYTDCHTRTIDNSVGQVVEMPREAVDSNRHRTCSDGLHVCSMSYLPYFGLNSGNNRVVVCKINPADVVAVPSDYNNAKMRVCRYEVVSELPRDEVGGLINTITPNYSDEWSDDDWSDDNGNYAGDDDFDDDWDDAGPTNVAEVLDEVEPPVNSQAKIGPDDVRAIRKDLQNNSVPLALVAEWWGISPRQVKRIRDREAWAWVKDFD